MAFTPSTFKEFVIRDKENDVEGLLAILLKQGYLAGIALEQWYPELADCLLITVTEKRTRAEIDGLVEAMCKSDSKQATPASTNTPKGNAWTKRATSVL